MPDSLVDFRLLEEHEISADRSAQLAGQLTHLTMPPRGLQHFLSLDILGENAARELASLVMSEPRLAAKVLGRANSPFYGLQSPIVSIPHAITYLGMNAVRSMALRYMLDDSFTAEHPSHQEYCDRVWDAGMIASELCSLLATKLNFTDVGALCTQTTLSFLGDLAVPALLPAGSAMSWNQGLIERMRLEQQEIGASAALMGTMLMRAWGLPRDLIDAVAATSRIAVTPVAQAEPASAARNALSFACARVGEAIAQRRIEHPEQVGLDTAGAPELHYLQGYLGLPQLARLPDLLQAPDVRLALLRMITSVNTDTAPG